MRLPEANSLPTFLPAPFPTALFLDNDTLYNPPKSLRHQTYTRATPLRHSLPSGESQGQLLRLGAGYFLRVHLGAIAVCARSSM